MPTLKTSEADHQKAVIEWAAWNEKKYPCLKFLYACPNEERAIQFRVKQKKMGVKSGVPDLFLPYPIKYKSPTLIFGTIPYKYCGLYIEMKTKDGKISNSQKEWIAYLKDQGYQVAVCWSADEAIKTIEEYLK